MSGFARRDFRTWLVAGLGCLALLVVALSVLQPAPAEGYTRPKVCGTIEANGKTFAVRGHLIVCRFARRASARYLRRGVKPEGWTCTRYPASATSIAFTCRKGGKDFYAIRR